MSMCFVNEGDWTAEVKESADIIAAELMKCSECFQKIQPGQFAHTIHQQEHGFCQICENGHCNCPLDEDGDKVCEYDDCQCAEPSFGETYDYVRCEGCNKFLQAVEAAEIEEGCAKYEARPMLPMVGDLRGIGKKECKRYWRKASAMFPAWKWHFAKLWRRMFG